MRCCFDSECVTLFFDRPYHILHIPVKFIVLYFILKLVWSLITNTLYTLQTVFASYSDRAIHFMELPGEIPNR
jgi:hypothetical protein